MNECPCCSDQLLRHIRFQEVYWFCSSCHQEMPNLSFSSESTDIPEAFLTASRLSNSF